MIKGSELSKFYSKGIDELISGAPSRSWFYSIICRLRCWFGMAHREPWPEVEIDPLLKVKKLEEKRSG